MRKGIESKPSYKGDIMEKQSYRNTDKWPVTDQERISIKQSS